MRIELAHRANGRGWRKGPELLTELWEPLRLFRATALEPRVGYRTSSYDFTVVERGLVAKVFRYAGGLETRGLFTSSKLAGGAGMTTGQLR